MQRRMKKILVTGSEGFIAQNLIYRLKDMRQDQIIPINRSSSLEDLRSAIQKADVIIHLAGVNRPTHDIEFEKVNFGLTDKICSLLEETQKRTQIIFSSSAQATLRGAYGLSKAKAEERLSQLNSKNGNPISIYRLPGVFGKWSRPNYNSVVSTFCYKIARCEAIEIRDETYPIELVYVDDVVRQFLDHLNERGNGVTYEKVMPCYKVSLGELADILQSFKEIPNTLTVGDVGSGLCRALYATFLSYLPPENFTYDLATNIDSRGTFTEALKTKTSGQYSFFTAKPGVTRGRHYHHTKSEKFVVVKGEALFKFKNVQTGESFEIETRKEKYQVVETIPGWAHSIKNVGNEEMIVLLWANETFDPERPDTVSVEV